MKTQADFERFFLNTLAPQLEPLEAERHRALNKVWVWMGIIACAAIILGSVGYSIYHDLEPLIVTGVIAVATATFAYNLITRQFRTDFKHLVIRELVQFIDEGLVYQADSCIDESTYWMSQLFRKRWDRYSGDDYVEGTIGQTPIQFSELHTEYKTETRDSKGRKQTHWHTIFKGLFFVADFNKEFKGSTFVLPDVAEKNFGLLGSWLQSNNNSHGELVKLEDPDFEKQFVVYGSDQVEARYILSTSLMDRIRTFQEKTGRPLHLAFNHNRVFIAISHRKDLFEPDVFKSLLDMAVVAEFFNDLAIAISIVEELNLNTRIWTKV